MPIYEFYCKTCHQKISCLARSFNQHLEPVCPSCGRSNLVRTISGFAYHKSLAAVWEESGEPTQFPGSEYYKDPRNIGRWAEKRFKEMGMEMPSQVQEMIQSAREGEMPESMKELKGAAPDAAYH